MEKKFLIAFSFLFLFSSSIIAQFGSDENEFRNVLISAGRVKINNPTSSILINSDEVSESENTLTVVSDFTMLYLWIFNDQGYEFFNSVDSNVYSLDIPDGNFTLITGYTPTENQHLMVVRENVVIDTALIIPLLQSEAVHKVRFELYREDFTDLHINTINFYIHPSIQIKGLHIMHASIDSTAFLFQVDTLPEYFNTEWSVKGKEGANNGNLYLLNNALAFSDSETIISNNPAQYTYADFNYYLPDSVFQVSTKQIFTFLPTTHIWSEQDAYKTYPIIQRIYQDTSANISLITSKFSQSLNSNIVAYNYLYTSDIRLGSNKVYGYQWRDTSSFAFIISDTNIVHVGLPPTYWFGKFINKNDTIKIRCSNKKWNYLFLSQSNDVLRHYPLEYFIYNDGSIIRHDFFNLLFGPVALRLGFNKNELTIPVVQGFYEMSIVDNYNEVAGYAGISRVFAGFDLQRTDKNPPYLTSFQILGKNQLSNHLKNQDENRIRFIAEDDEQVDSLSLFYAKMTDTSWSKLSLIYSTPYFETQLPELEESYYKLKLYAADSSGNFIETYMEPAFKYDFISSVPETNTITVADKFSLYQNYPNPFNSSTEIRFNKPANYLGPIEINIYNILGKKVRSFSARDISSTSNKLIWNGRNSLGKRLSSGIYIIQLKGGYNFQSIKALLIN